MSKNEDVPPVLELDLLAIAAERAPHALHAAEADVVEVLGPSLHVVYNHHLVIPQVLTTYSYRQNSRITGLKRLPAQKLCK